MNSTVLLLMDFQTGIADKSWAAAAVEHAAVARTAAHGARLATVFTHVSFRAGFADVSPLNKFFWTKKLNGVLPTGPARFLPRLLPDETDIVVAKNRFSAFAGNDLATLLRAQFVTRLVLCGISTSGVVLSTALVASDLDFEVTVLSDACADDVELHEGLVTAFLPRCCEVISTREWVDSLV